MMRRLYILSFIACSILSAKGLELPESQKFFQEGTFAEFAYPNGELDSVFTQQALAKARQQWSTARKVQVASYITRDNIRDVVAYYSVLCGQRFEKIDELFMHVFSEIDGQLASKIEIEPVPLVKIHPAFWPVRITLCHVAYPISANVNPANLPTEEEFRNRLQRLCYTSQKGHVTYQKEYSILLQEELGEQSEVFILDTDDDMSEVYRYFRKNYRGSISISLGRDGSLSTEYFEIDGTFAAGLNPDQYQLTIQVDENPIVFDDEGNSQLLRNHVLIRYIFWRL